MEINVNEITLFYEKIGKGIPLVFVHGNQEDHSIFLELVNQLKEDFTCYLFDSRNHGRSSKTNVFDYQHMASDYLEALKQLGLSSPYFLGYSDGGIVGLLMALSRPHVFKKMIICGANIHPSGIAKKERIALLDEVLNAPNPYLQMMIDQPNISLNKLHNITIPTMIIAGEFDVIQRRHTLAIQRHIQGSKLLFMQKKHHDDYLVHRDDLTPWILDFFTAA